MPFNYGEWLLKALCREALAKSVTLLFLPDNRQPPLIATLHRGGWAQNVGAAVKTTAGTKKTHWVFYLKYFPPTTLKIKSET